MAKLPDIYSDPTLDAMNRILEEKQAKEQGRRYLGASIIGNECWRKSFYSFRNAEKKLISASGIKAIQDGYDQEAKTIERLREIPGIEIFNDDGNGNQIGFEMLSGHFRGHVDGVITGLLQSPKTPHIFEHKAVNTDKFKKLTKIIAEAGEKAALKEWDIVYYEQAQVYMKAFELTRHYTVVSTPGGRDHTSCRTDYDPKYAENIIIKAKSIIFDENIPTRLSEKREFFQCKWCEYQGICHDGDIPQVNCRTCRYSMPVENGEFKCAKKDVIITDIFSTCNYHVFNSSLVPAKAIEQQAECCIYSFNDITFANCSVAGLPDFHKKIDMIYTSTDLRDKIKNVNNLTKTTVKVQNAFNGEFINDKKIKKSWEE